MWQWHVDLWACLDVLFTALLFLVVVVLVRVHSIVRRKRKVMGALPEYPGCLPLIGHAHLANKFTYTEFIDEMIKTSKEIEGSLFSVWLGPMAFVYLTNPIDINNILNRRDALNKGELFNLFQSHSDGLLNTTIPNWCRSRKLAITPLGHKKMIESFLNIYQQQSQILMDVFTRKGINDHFDVYPYLSRCCQDITYESHFGVKLEVQKNTQLSAHISVAKTVTLVLERMMKAWLFLDVIYFRTKKGKIMQTYITHNQNIANKIIATRRKILEEKTSYNTDESLKKKFPKLLDVNLDKKNGLTDGDIVHEIMDVMLAGFETMSLTQSWVLLLLAMHPEHQNSVHEELDRTLGDSRPLDLSMLAECCFLDRCTKEALRLFGLPIVIRQLTSNVQIENYTLPAYTQVGMGMNVVHRDPRFWEHPDKFHPDHFLPEQEAKRPNYAFIPFGGGLRKCPASAYSSVVVKFVVASLLRKYRFATLQRFDNLPLELFFMYKPIDGFLLKLEPR